MCISFIYVYSPTILLSSSIAIFSVPLVSDNIESLYFLVTFAVQIPTLFFTNHSDLQLY